MNEQDAQNHDNSSSEIDIQNGDQISIAVEEDLPGEDLQKWYDEYMAEDGDLLSSDSEVILALEGDSLDNEAFEEEVAKFAAHVEGEFCLQCQTLMDNWPDVSNSPFGEPDVSKDLMPHEKYWEHHVSMKRFRTHELEAATRQGCRFCALIRQILLDNDMLETYRKVEGRLSHFTNDMKIALSIQNWANFTQTKCQLLWPNLPGKVCTSCNSGYAMYTKFESNVIPIPDGSSIAQLVKPVEDVFESARRWMKTCTKEHERCKAEETGVLPTRLLSIAANPPKLVLTADLTSRPRYATLSHCWGGNVPSRLIAEELDLRLKAVPLEELPKSFTDAIKIARELGFEYLWIDSLCIIQDDKEDWLQESSVMASVYGGTSLNIAASSATDSSKGCFLKPLYYSGGIRAKVTVNSEERVQDFKDSAGYSRATSMSFLATRAWAIQERLLAPRTIHFGNRGAFWECGMTIASESLPDGFGEYLADTLVAREVGLRSYWRAIVMQYSEANLTYSKDKLPALSGIARKTYSETGDQYLAGMWKEDIETQLCWKPDTLRSRPPWRAPTWSWTSVDGRVVYPSNQEGLYEDVYTHLVDAEITTVGGDPFGQVTRAVLRLGCSVITVGHFDQEEIISDDLSQERSITITSGEKEQNFRVSLDCKNENSDVNKKPVYMLPILGGKTGTRYSGVEVFMVHGILLQETGSSRGEFSRFGSFTFTKNSGPWRHGGLSNNEDYEPFLKILEETGTKTAEGICAKVVSNDEHPNERYIITVI